MLKAILSTLGIFFIFTITTFAQCEINDLVATPTDCDADGNFFVEISFTVQNPISGTFFITNGNQGGVPPVNYGEFEYGQPSYTVGPLVGDGVNSYGFFVFDSEDIVCGAVTVVDPVNCTNNCAISNLDFISFTNCNADNEYFVEIEFLATNGSNDGFTVTGNGMNYGTFEYGQASYSVGPFLASNQASYEIIVTDVDDSACQDVVFFDSQLCNGGPCTIENTFVEYLDCNNDNEFYIQVGIEGENLVADFYQIFIDNNYVGNFSTDEPFYELGPLAGDGSDYEILVRNIGNANCVLAFEVEGIECGNDCEIDITVIEAHDCDNDGNFLVDFEIEYSGQGDEGFTVFGNGMNYGNFEYGQTFYTVGSFAGDGVSGYEIIIQDLEATDCQVFTGFDALDCDGNDDCEITNTFIEYLNCNNDGEFFIQVGVEVENPVSSTFNIVGNGVNYGNFPYGQPFYEIGPFEGNGAIYELIFIDEDSGDCQAEVVFEGIECTIGGDCFISDMELTPSDCDNDGNYDLTINFIAQNPNNAFFDLFINGEFYEFYSLADLPITIENFPDGGLTVPYVNVCINDNPDCCFENEFVAPDCDNNDCAIEITVVEAHECDEDGNFLVDFEIEYSGQGDEGFTVFGNGMNYGNFEYGQTFYTVGPFAGNGASVEVIIQDLEVTDCQTFTGFNAPDCGVPNLVWPGDLNNDNIANNLDLLNLGLAFNSTGEPRAMQGIEWSALPATEWDSFFENGVNYVFADANGDGTAEGDDQNAIEVNYDLTHGDVVENYDEAGEESDPELFVDLPSSDGITIGQAFTAPIILGTNDIPVGDIYGLAFTLVFDPTIIDPATVEIDYSANWMGQNGVNILTLDKKLAIGEVDMVLTKNDQNNVGGFGQIAAFIGIIDNIAGKTEVEIEIKDVRAINRGEETVFLQRPIDMIEVTVSTSTQLTNNNINIYPNPTMDELIIANSQHLPMTSVEIRNASGKLVTIFENGDKKMDVSSLPSGVYLLKFEIGERMYYERFVKM